MDRASAPSNPRMVSTATVMIAVVSGNRQNSHSMMLADAVMIAISAMTFARMDLESVMPASPRNQSMQDLQIIIHIALLNLYTANTVSFHPSMVSRRQWRAVSAKSSSAPASDAAADIIMSRVPIGSSLSTLVISRCWLKEGMNI